MTWPVARIGGPIGIQPAKECVDVMNRTGTTLVLGDLVMFDLHSTETGDNIIVGDTNSVFTNVIVPATLGLTHGFFGVVTDLKSGAGADNTEVEVCVRGIVDARVASATAVTAVLIAANASDALDDTAGIAGQKILGIPLEASTAADTILVLFDGIYGFGASPDQA